MSVSKLESLPNEILVDLFENYVNGIDIINAFAFQLNRRFDEIIMQCRRFRFDFIRCRKDDFRVFMNVVPAYVDKIEELAPAERYTPGLIHAFLLKCPFFARLKNLRKLYLQGDYAAMGAIIFEKGLQSLRHTALHTLSLTISSAILSRSLDDRLEEIFYIKTLKKLSIDVDFIRRRRVLVKEGSSRIEYLKLRGAISVCIDLQCIFQCIPVLRYLSIEMFETYCRSSFLSNLSLSDALPTMSMLQTAIFDLQCTDSTILNILQIYLKRMPSLKHLGLKVKDYTLHFAYETFIQTAFILLPSLISFTLYITLTDITAENVSKISAFTEKRVWTENERLNLIIQGASQSTEQWFNLNASNRLSKEEGNDVVFHWNTNHGPTMSDKLSVLNRISNLCLFPQSHSLLQNYYLNNVTHLFINGLDDRLFTCITAHINCLRIQHLDLSSMTGNSLIFPMLESTTNMRSLRINFRQLHDDLNHHSRIYENVQSLDLSADPHTFSENDIFVISRIFPQLEHLIIYTDDLRNVPMLETNLPRLRHFTFFCAELNGIFQFDALQNEQFDVLLRRKTKFIFQRNGNWITVLIDQAALRDPYWGKIVRIDDFIKSAIRSFMKNTIETIVSILE